MVVFLLSIWISVLLVADCDVVFGDFWFGRCSVDDSWLFGWAGVG